MKLLVLICLILTILALPLGFLVYLKYKDDEPNRELPCGPNCKICNRQGRY